MSNNSFEVSDSCITVETDKRVDAMGLLHIPCSVGPTRNSTESSSWSSCGHDRGVRD